MTTGHGDGGLRDRLQADDARVGHFGVAWGFVVGSHLLQGAAQNRLLQVDIVGHQTGQDEQRACGEGGQELEEDGEGRGRW